MSFLTIPSVATVSRHFTKHRGLATGVTIAGSSTGGVVWPIALDRLINADGVSFGWTLRIVGFAMLFSVTLATLLVRDPARDAPKASAESGEKQAQPSQKRKMDLSIIKSPPYILFVIGAAIYNLAMFAPFFFLTSYAVSIGKSTSFAFYLLSVLSGASLVGRISMGVLADQFGPFNLVSITAVVSAIIAYCWTTATSIAGLVVWAIAFGFTSGVSQSSCE